MEETELLTNDTGHISNRNASSILPGTVYPVETPSKSLSKPLLDSASQSKSLASFAGPTVSGKPTTVALYAPVQIQGTPIMPSLRAMVNNAFSVSHAKTNTLPGSIDRLRSEQQYLDELGAGPDVFTYIITYSGTNEVIATAGGRRFVGGVEAVSGDPDQVRQNNTFRRLGPPPPDTEVWELKHMAVDPQLQRQGLAGYLMSLVEEEVKRRFKATSREKSNSSDNPTTKLMIFLTSINEINGEFYSRKGFTEDYQIWYEKGHYGSDTGFTVTHMSKTVNIE